MNIIVGVAVCACSLYFFFRHRPTGHDCIQALVACLASGVFTALTVNPLHSVWSAVFLAVQLLLCCVLLCIYRKIIRRHKAEKARQNAAIAAARAQRAELARRRAQASLEQYFIASQAA